MPIEFRCKQCARLLRVPDEAAGRQAKCPECGAVSPIPAPSAGVPQWAPPSDSENPYQAPTQYGQAPGYPYAWGDAAAAAARVAGPAIALIIIGALEIAVEVWAVFVTLTEFRAGRAARLGPWADLVTPEAVVIGGAIGVILGIVVIWGGVKMRNLEGYPLAMAAAIIAMIPCFWPCCMLGLPFGIWALVVLSDPMVRAAFRRE
jgi:phage FluMu protein Com